MFSHATYRVGNAVVLILALENGLGHNRLGLVVSKKKVPSAVARNQVKRVIRDSFRKHPCIAQGLDMVVLMRGQFKSKSDLRESLANGLGRLAGKVAKKVHEEAKT